MLVRVCHVLRILRCQVSIVMSCSTVICWWDSLRQLPCVFQFIPIGDRVVSRSRPAIPRDLNPFRGELGYMPFSTLDRLPPSVRYDRINEFSIHISDQAHSHFVNSSLSSFHSYVYVYCMCIYLSLTEKFWLPSSFLHLLLHISWSLSHYNLTGRFPVEFLFLQTRRIVQYTCHSTMYM